MHLVYVVSVHDSIKLTMCVCVGLLTGIVCTSDIWTHINTTIGCTGLTMQTIKTHLLFRCVVCRLECGMCEYTVMMQQSLIAICTCASLEQEDYC